MADVKAGTLYIEVRADGVQGVNSSLEQLNRKTEETTRSTRARTAQMQTTWGEFSSFVLQRLAAMTTAIVSVQQVMRGFHDVMSEEVAFVRLGLQLSRLGLGLDENREKIQAWMEQWRYLTGIQEEVIYTGISRLLPLLGDISQALRLADVAMRVHLTTGAEYSQIVEILTRLLQGLNIRGAELNRVFWVNADTLKKVNEATGEMAELTIDAQKALQEILEVYSGSEGQEGLNQVLNTYAFRMKQIQTMMSELREVVVTPLLTALLEAWKVIKLLVELLDKLPDILVEVIAAVRAVSEAFRLAWLHAGGYWGMVKQILSGKLPGANFFSELQKQLEGQNQVLKQALDNIQEYISRASRAVYGKQVVPSPIPGAEKITPAGSSGSGVAAGEQRKKEKEEALQEVIEANEREAEAFKEMENQKMRIAERSTEYILSMWEQLFLQGRLSWQALVNDIKRLIWSIVEEIIRSQVLEWISRMIGAVSPKSGVPVNPAIPGVDNINRQYNIAGTMMPPPSSGGGIRVSISGSPSGTLVKVYDGMSKQEKEVFARQVFLIGASNFGITG